MNKILLHLFWQNQDFSYNALHEPNKKTVVRIIAKMSVVTAKNKL